MKLGEIVSVSYSQMRSNILEKTNYFEDDMNPDETQTDLANFLKYLDDNEASTVKPVNA